MQQEINQKIQINKQHAYNRTKNEAMETKQEKTLTKQQMEYNRQAEEQRA